MHRDGMGGMNGSIVNGILERKYGDNYHLIDSTLEFIAVSDSAVREWSSEKSKQKSKSSKK
jgi:hypothetical protein